MKRRGRMMRAVIFAAVAAATVAAASTGCGSSSAENGTASSALRDATGIDWIVSTNRETGAVTFATPKTGSFAIPGASGSLEQTTLAFLAKHKTVFKMYDPSTELAFVRTERSGNGTSHVRFQQQVAGVPVHGGQWIAHFDASGRLSSMNGNYAVDAHRVATTPTLPASDAEAAAKTEATRRRPSVPGSALTTTVRGLEVVPVRGAAPVLAYVVKVRSSQAGTALSLIVYVDATTAAVRLVVNGIQRGTATALPPQSYPPYGVTTAPNLTFPVSDTDPPVLSATGRGGVLTSVISAAQPGLGFIPAAATTPYWADVITPRGVAAAAQANADVVLAYLAEHERNGQPYRSFEGQGAPLVSIVNDNSEGSVNAFWDSDPDAQTMHYGDGDPNALIFPFSASLDMTAHEVGHGVTSATSRFETADGTESYALNESMSDVIAAFVTHRVRNDDGKDFTFGEDCTRAAVPFRSMIQPRLSSLLETGGISTYDEFLASDKESHRGSNVPSHAFYLLTHGGTHETTRYKVPCGIGWGAADRLYWRVQTSFATSTDTFKDFALHSLRAARDLQITERPIACAWVAVKVLTEDEARNDWNVTCEKDEADGAPSTSDSILVTQPAQLVECSVSLTEPGGSLTR